MEAKEPTKAQVKEFWEWYGVPELRYVDMNGGVVVGYPPIDLNNLFKYAVPKLLESGYTIICESVKYGVLFLYEWYFLRGNNEGIWQASMKDPALALFWAIWEVIKDDK